MPWLTPDTIPTEKLCRELLIPNDPVLVSAVTGALLDLTFADNWEQEGVATPGATAAAMLEMVNQFFEGCMVALRQPTILVDVKAQNTQGGTANSGAWQIRTLNTIEGNGSNGVTLSSNVFTLPQGDWLVKWSAPAFFCLRHQTRLFAVAANQVQAVGQSTSSENAGTTVTHSQGVWTGEVRLLNTFRIEHRVQNSRATDGFGVAANFGEERYTIVEIYPVN